MNTLVFNNHLNKKNTLNSPLNTLRAFELVRGLSESELETLELLLDIKNKKILEQSINESKKNKIEPIESIL